MKKTLVAMAALASISAFAQSSVTLYGIGDMWFGTLKVGAPGAAVSQTVLNSGGLSGSRFGLRGSEDLGGGLKAEFQFENGFSLDSGVTSTSNSGVLGPAGSGFAAGNTVASTFSKTAAAAAGTVDSIFARQAFIGLSGGFGGLRLGRQYSSYDELRGATDTMGHTSFSGTVGAMGVWEAVGTGYTARVNNMIRYETPNMSGFSATVSYGLGENKTAVASADSIVGFKAQYANGPLLVGLGYQNETAVSATGVKFAGKGTLVAGTYDLGVAKVFAGFNSVSATGSLKDKDFQIGASVPMGAFSLAAQYATAKTSTAGVTTAKGNTLSLQGIYALSKRTNAYVGLANGKIKNGAGATTRKGDLFAVGLRHTF